MKLYSSMGPNPKMVRIFMAEKGIELEKVEVDIRGGENRKEPYLSTVNPTGGSPALQLDNGAFISEITAICEYLDETGSGPSLIGATPEERAETRMWTRRVDLGICEPMTNGFRFSQGLEMFKDRFLCMPQAADDLKATAARNLAWLDKQMDGKTWICGERFTMADIMLYAFVGFFAKLGQAPDESLKNVNAWMARMAARPSARA
ncbi:MAG: glutathione S-transferase family protein [Pseudomonadota bacterium]|nr:glutathione S-transferase family protein [Pseudomonadota bacterium]